MRVIRASEIAEYVFCRRAWWLHHVQGLAPANVQELAAGTSAHAGHGRLVWVVSALRTLAILLVVAALGLIIFSLMAPGSH
jgi:hypothetical protein